MADYGLEVYDEGGRLVFDNNSRLFKIIGETTIRGDGTFQIPLRPGERPLAIPVWRPLNINWPRMPVFNLDEVSGLLRYQHISTPLLLIYGVW